MLEIEYESRLIISEEKHSLILSFYKKRNQSVSPIIQTNYYYDTPERQISKTGSILRLRANKTKNKYVITYKEKGVSGDSEFTQFLTSLNDLDKVIKTGIFPDGDAIKKLKEIGININSLRPFGSIETTRYEFQDGDSLIVIDKNVYLGVIDYNIEVESSTKEKAINKMKELCNKFGLHYIEEDTSKSHRVIELYLQQKSQNI